MLDKTILAGVLLAACSSTEPAYTVQPRVIQPGDALNLTWSPGQNLACEGCAPRQTVDCGHEISHPCPYVLFATFLGIEGTMIVIGRATGGSDANGVPAENHAPWYDDFAMDGECLILPQRGDDGGLRHASQLCPSVDGGYEGDVEWSLFNVAGYTVFHATLEFQK